MTTLATTHVEPAREPCWTSHELRAMGTDVRLLLEHPLDRDAADAIAESIELLGQLAATFTRFDAASELRLLERRRAMRCSPELLEVLDLALDARRASAGRFDPTLRDAMVAIGYDRTFTEVQRRPHPAARPAPGGGGIAIDPSTGIVALAPGTSLDLGGIAKGWIADRVAERLAQLAPALVDAGGDIACTPRAGGAPWRVAVAGTDLQLELGAGGVATSGIDRRRWRDPASGVELHHVIDPATGTSAHTDLIRVTVLAASCAAAEAASTALLVAGRDAAPRLAARMGCAWWSAVAHDGTVIGQEGSTC
jgi:thiamine biosynthesis lipoprotein